MRDKSWRVRPVYLYFMNDILDLTVEEGVGVYARRLRFYGLQQLQSVDAVH